MASRVADKPVFLYWPLHWPPPPRNLCANGPDHWPKSGIFHSFMLSFHYKAFRCCCWWRCWWTFLWRLIIEILWKTWTKKYWTINLPVWPWPVHVSAGSDDIWMATSNPSLINPWRDLLLEIKSIIQNTVSKCLSLAGHGRKHVGIACDCHNVIMCKSCLSSWSRTREKRQSVLHSSTTQGQKFRFHHLKDHGLHSYFKDKTLHSSSMQIKHLFAFKSYSKAEV